MKYIYLFFIFYTSSLLAQVSLPIVQSNVAKNHVVLNYDFTKTSSYSGSGSVVNNIGSNLSGAATLYNSPAFTNTLGFISFNGTSQYLVTPYLNPSFNSLNSGRQETYTLSMWIYPINSSGVIVSDLGQGTINTSYHASSVEMVNGYLYYSVWPKTTLVTSSAVSLNQWHHVVIVYDGTYVNGYLDGVLQGTANYSKISPTYQYFALAATDSTNMGSGAYGKFNLAKFKMYNIPLSSGDVLREYNEEKFIFQYKMVLDAGSSSSYPGSGSTWYDISGNQKNAINYYCGYSGGSISYDGVNSYSDFYVDVSTTNTVTVETWVKINAIGGMIFGWGLYDIWTNNGSLGFNTAIGDVYGLSSTDVTNLGIVGNWKHMVFVMNNGSYLSNKIYINGVLQPMTQVYASMSSANATFNSGYGRISGWRNDVNWKMNFNMATFKIYDREVGASEVVTKFNNEKSRYGL